MTTNRTANACFKDAADLHADLEEYSKAIARYEQVADHSLGSALTKYSVKEYWLRAGLCALAMNVSILRIHLVHHTPFNDLLVIVRTLSLPNEIWPSIPHKTRPLALLERQNS